MGYAVPTIGPAPLDIRHCKALPGRGSAIRLLSPFAKRQPQAE
jgi:hypothetical protein